MGVVRNNLRLRYSTSGVKGIILYSSWAVCDTFRAKDENSGEILTLICFSTVMILLTKTWCIKWQCTGVLCSLSVIPACSWWLWKTISWNSTVMVTDTRMILNMGKNFCFTKTILHVCKYRNNTKRNYFLVQNKLEWDPCKTHYTKRFEAEEIFQPQWSHWSWGLKNFDNEEDWSRMSYFTCFI